MSVAQGTSLAIAAWAQTGLGVPRSGNGAQLLRRESGMGKLAVATYQNSEITEHRQSTGKTHGGRSATFSLNGLLSGGSYSTLLASILRKAFTATTAFAASTITISGTAALYTFTASAATPTFLTLGLKAGDVVRLSAAGGTAANLAHNILVVNVTTELVFTGVTLNDVALTPEAITTCTVTVVGKKAIVAATSQTSEYWTVEEWSSDISQSSLYTDLVWGSADVSLPATGNTTVAFNAVALDRTIAGTRVLTTPTAETTSKVTSSINGIVLVNGAAVANVTGATLKIDGAAAPIGAVLGSNVSPDIQRGILSVSGQVTAFWENGTMSGYFDAATPIGLVLVVAVDDTNASEFVSFSMSKVTLDSDDRDDGQKAIVRTYAFTAEINGAGGAILANDKTILSVQDSLA